MPYKSDIIALLDGIVLVDDEYLKGKAGRFILANKVIRAKQPVAGHKQKIGDGIPP
jgi:hypothetical protein